MDAYFASNSDGVYRFRMCAHGRHAEILSEDYGREPSEIEDIGPCDGSCVQQVSIADSAEKFCRVYTKPGALRTKLLPAYTERFGRLYEDGYGKRSCAWQSWCCGDTHVTVVVGFEWADGNWQNPYSITVRVAPCDGSCRRDLAAEGFLLLQE